jgi:APA family basic amino acid/polyamine antiporter
MPDGTAAPPRLERRLGALDAALITIGGVIGTGIFITSGDMARILPSTGWILAVWAAGGLLSLAGALTYAELGAMFPYAGGIYHYLRQTYGPVWGFLYGWASFGVVMSGGIAAIAVGFGVYLGTFVPWFGPDHLLWSLPVGPWHWSVNGAQVAGAVAILVLTAVNYVGLREGAWVQNLLTAIKLGAIAVFVVGGFLVAAPVASDALPAATVPAGGPSVLTAFGIAMIAALWTYDGWYGATFSAGEMRRPERDLPIGLIAGTGAITLIYVLLNVVYARALPLAAMAATPRIGETAAAVLFGAGGGRWMAAAVLVSTFGCLSATILYTSRIYLPMAEDGLFFRRVASIHPRFHTPGVSLWSQSAWAILLTLSGSYDQLYTYVVFVAVGFHVMTGMAVFILRRRHPEASRPYRVWGYPVVPALFVLASLLLLGNTVLEKPVESLLGLGLTALGLPAYIWWRRQLPREPFVPGRRLSP